MPMSGKPGSKSDKSTDNTMDKSDANKLSDSNYNGNRRNIQRAEINSVELVEARRKEIQFIEESIGKTNKKTMLFQRLPFYKRRRNRNYDKKTGGSGSKKKFSYRKKDRHFLRTHTFYAKRFFMLKLEFKNNGLAPHFLSIPYKRRIKSSKYIYKSRDRGFLLDESFRSGFVYESHKFMQEVVRIRAQQGGEQIYYDKDDDCCKIEDASSCKRACIEPNNTINPLILQISMESIAHSINLDKYDQIQTVDSLYEIILTKESIYVIGARIHDSKSVERPIDSILAVFCKDNYGFHELLNVTEYKIFKDVQGGIQSYKIICSRSQVMAIYQALINRSIIPICLEEVFRLCLESDEMSVYDNIKGTLFCAIEEAINKEIIEKYNRTPSGKRVSMDINDLFVCSRFNDINRENIKYHVFRAIKGSPERSGFIFKDNTKIGRILRSSYKFSNGSCFGLCVLDIKNEAVDSLDFYKSLKLFSQNVGQSNFYEIEIVKSF